MEVYTNVNLPKMVGEVGDGGEWTWCRSRRVLRKTSGTSEMGKRGGLWSVQDDIPSVPTGRETGSGHQRSRVPERDPMRTGRGLEGTTDVEGRTPRERSEKRGRVQGRSTEVSRDEWTDRTDPPGSVG